MSRILDHDPETGLTETFSSNPDGGFTIKTSQDVEPNLDRNAQARLMASTGWKGDLHEVASIDEIVWLQWWNELGSDPGSKENRPWLIAKLNSREFSKLRTKEGQI